MNTRLINHTFEISVCNLRRSMPIVAVGQSLNTLLPGDVLKVNACSEGTTALLSEYCSITGHTLLRHIEADNDVTLYVRKA